MDWDGIKGVDQRRTEVDVDIEAGLTFKLYPCHERLETLTCHPKSAADLGRLGWYHRNKLPYLHWAVDDAPHGTAAIGRAASPARQSAVSCAYGLSFLPNEKTMETTKMRLNLHRGSFTGVR